MSEETIVVLPVGDSTRAKMAFPSARVCVNSAKHHLELNQFLVRIRMTAWDRSISR